LKGSDQWLRRTSAIQQNYLHKYLLSAIETWNAVYGRKSYPLVVALNKGS